MVTAGTTYNWYFGNNVNETDKIQKWLADGETIVSMYRYKDNIGVFTDRRIIFKGIAIGDAKLIGKETYMYCIPYKSVDLYAYEVSDTTLFDAYKHIDIWTRGGSHIGILIAKDTDINPVKKILLENII